MLSYEGVAQLVPVVLLALLWPRMTGPGAAGGLVVGIAVIFGLWSTGHDPLFGVNGGVIALAANVTVTVILSLSRPAGRPSAGRRGGTPAATVVREPS